MSQEEARDVIALECPRRIMGALHHCGQYVHGTSQQFPGKVLCFHARHKLPADWQPTEAQGIVSACLDARAAAQ